MKKSLDCLLVGGLTGILVSFLVAVLNYFDKSTLREKGLICSIISCYSPSLLRIKATGM